MTVTQGDPYQKPASQPAAPPDGPAGHVTLVDRVAALEQWAARLNIMHNQLAADVVSELGL